MNLLFFPNQLSDTHIVISIAILQIYSINLEIEFTHFYQIVYSYNSQAHNTTQTCISQHTHYTIHSTVQVHTYTPLYLLHINKLYYITITN